MEKVQIREEYAPKLFSSSKCKEHSLNESATDKPLNDKNLSESVSLILENNILLSKKLELIEQQLNYINSENEKLKELIIFSKLRIDELISENERLTKIFDEFQNSIPTLLRRSKDEYISALQCETEISRNIFIRELQRFSGNSLKGHGDPFFL